MPWIALAIGGSALVGANASKRAAATQAASTDAATQLQERMFNKQVELQEPWRQAGVNALARLESGDVMREFDPSYSFRFTEGMKALDRNAAARGGLISGSALKAAQRYGQDLASTEFSNAYNRLASRAGLGQTSATNVGNAAANFGANAGNMLTSGAAARASGYVGGANALTSGLGQYLNYTQGQNLLNRLAPVQTGALTGPSNAALEAQMYGG